MKVIDFLQLKNDTYGVRYFNNFSIEYTPSPDDNIAGISFHKSDVSGKSEYHIFTDSVKNVKIDNMTIGNIKRYCKETVCEQCPIHEFCLNAFSVIPRKW